MLRDLPVKEAAGPVCPNHQVIGRIENRISRGNDEHMTSFKQSEVDVIETMIVKHARDAFVSADVIDRQWRRLNYTDKPDFGPAVEEYERFVDLLGNFDIKLHFLPQDENSSLDSLYARDAAIVCKKGMILCNMGKAERRNEPSLQEVFYRDRNIPVQGRITGTGRVEGGDVAWIDEKTLVVGRGYRTNDEGIRQLGELLRGLIRELIVVHLPHWKGPDDVFHLMSVLSPLDHDLALVYSPLMPVPLREALLSRGMVLVEVPDEEFDTMGCNVLAVAPRKCVMLDGNPITRKRLEKAGVEVHEFVGREICAKGAGGPTCLTRPLLRA